MGYVAKKKSSASDGTSAEKPLDPSTLGAEDDTLSGAEQSSPDDTEQADSAEGGTEPDEREQESVTDATEAAVEDGTGSDDQDQEAITDTKEADEPDDQGDATTNSVEEQAAEAADMATSEAPAEPAPAPGNPPAAPEKVIVERGGFVPMLLGGAAAAAIGFGLSLAILPDGWQGKADQDALRGQLEERLAGQAETLESIQAQLQSVGAAPDLSPIETELSGIGSAIGALGERLGSAETTLEQIETRLAAVEKQPVADGASEAAVAAYERELDDLRESMAAQRAEIEAMIEEARAVEEETEEAANAAMRRAAVTRILTALDTGTGFAPALADLEATGTEVPEVLAQVADEGVASLADLQESFPDMARAALSASRRAAVEGGEASGVGAFLRTQLGARSLEPREGNDPDAILSRAEAAIRDGRLSDALAEIEALPESGRTELVGEGKPEARGAGRRAGPE